MTLLNAVGVVAGYGVADEIVRGVSLRSDAGEIVSIIGPNGAGKSTLLKTLAGVLRPRTGAISFAGQDVSVASPRRRATLGLAYAAQESNIFPALTVRENLEIGGYGIAASIRQQRIEQVLTRMPALRSRLSATAGRLSGGQRQMLAVASALMAAPRLILLDEPSAGLSPAATQALFDVLVELRGTGIGLLMIEQNVLDALAISDRAYVIVLGRNLRDGPAGLIAADPEIRRTFLGL